MVTDLNCLSYWFPILQTSGVNIPETHIVKTSVDLGQMCDKERIPLKFDTFLFDLIKAGNKVGYPNFLRTGHGASKHNWKNSCFIEKRFDYTSHIRALVEWSECVDMMGLPYNVWAVRKLIKTKPFFTAFKGFPVVKERRYFIENGKVVCGHSYWPPESITNPSVPDWKEKIREMNFESFDERKLLAELSEKVARVFTGAWSVDWLQDADGRWWCTDMAEARRSYHWEGCVNEERFG